MDGRACRRRFGSWCCGPRGRIRAASADLRRAGQARLGDQVRLELHEDGVADDTTAGEEMARAVAEWQFAIADRAFDATFGLELFKQSQRLEPVALHRH